MYLADYHTHSTCSDDGHNTMTEMAEAGSAAGLDEICLTDHLDVVDWQGNQVYAHSWSETAAQFAAARQALGARIKIQLGVELGQATEDFDRADRFLDDAPPLDFIIGSLHNLSWEHGRKDFCTLTEADEGFARQAIGKYLEEMQLLAQWGRFSVIGHLTLPLRYLNENLGMQMTFAGFEEQLRQLFQTIIPRGIGIELNTNRGNTPLPDREILKLYHDMGGELITLGSDAHTPNYVGCAIRERQQLLRELGFSYFVTYERLQPVYHKL